MSDFESRARKAAEAVRGQIEDAATDEERNLRRAKRHTNSRVVLPSTLLVVLIVAAGLFAINTSDSSPVGHGPAGSPFELAGALQPFNACDDALQYFKDEAPQYYIAQTQQGGGRVMPLEGSVGAPGPMRGPITTTSAPNAPQNSSAQAAAPSTDAAPGTGAAPNAATGTAAPTTAPQFSTTNVQEVGVDEPDTIKTNGNTVVTVNAGSVYVLAANNGNPEVKAKLAVSNVDSLLLSGTHLLLLSGQNGSQTLVTTFDISDLSHPVEIGALQMDGNLIDARMVGTQVRVATSYTPQPDIPSPAYDDSGNPSQRSIKALPGEVAATTLQDWVPQYSELNGNGATIKSGQLVQCADLAHPSTFSGLNTIALTVFDAGAAPTPTHSVGVVASGGSQMYATASNTYISSTDWQRDGSSPTSTEIHEFTTGQSGVSAYTGSGSVDGTLLSSYSMSEDNGVLRVATTVSGSRGWINQHEVSGGDVTTLRIRNNKLAQVGKLTGLGQRDNESITAVRFVGPRAYVSTARQTDPFFVVDLSDPANPKLGGQLQVPGQSSYLEPLSNNLILSVGQSVANGGGGVPMPVPMPYPPTTDGPLPYGKPGAPSDVAPGIMRPFEQSQVQYTLYDVSNPALPKQVGQLTYGAGQAGAAFDPHAFLYWQPRNLVISPANVYNIDGLQQFSGLLLMQADGTNLKEIGRLADTEYKGSFNGFQVTRSIVIGNNVYLLSNDNLQVDSLDTHAQVASVSLPA